MRPFFFLFGWENKLHWNWNWSTTKQKQGLTTLYEQSDWMMCWTIHGTHPFHTWFVPLHFAHWARACAALLYSLFRWQTFQLQKDSRREIIPWYRWPELPFVSFAWRSWTTVRASDSKITWVSLITLAKRISFSRAMISVSKSFALTRAYKELQWPHLCCSL